jgi:hypothetical protein
MASPLSPDLLALLKAELLNDPAQRGYSAQIVAQQAVLLNSPYSGPLPAPVQAPVGRGDVRELFDNFVDGSGIPAWEAVEAHRTDQSALGVACRAAIRLRDAPADYPTVVVTSPLFVNMVAALVGGGVISTAQQAYLAALGQSQPAAPQFHPRLTDIFMGQVDAPNAVTADDVAAALAS